MCHFPLIRAIWTDLVFHPHKLNFDLNHFFNLPKNCNLWMSLCSLSVYKLSSFLLLHLFHQLCAALCFCCVFLTDSHADQRSISNKRKVLIHLKNQAMQSISNEMAKCSYWKAPRPVLVKKKNWKNWKKQKWCLKVFCRLGTWPGQS